MTQSNRDQTYVFYGALRSGTTMLRLMANMHPDIHCPGERDFLVDHLHPSPEGGLTLNAEALAEDRIFRDSGLSVPKATEGHAAFWEMIEEDRARSGKRVYLIVLHRGLARTRDVFPEARYIHLLRDPRDVARSSIGMGWAGNTWFGVDHWMSTEHEWNAFAPPAVDTFVLRYEALVEAPETNLKALCAFMGLDYTDAMMRYSETSTYEPVDPKLAHQWRRKQTVQEVSELEHKLGTLLAETGYAASQAGPKAPIAMRRLALRLQNRASIWKTRIGRFGLIDPILLGVARRTGLKQLGRAAKLRMDERILQQNK